MVTGRTTLKAIGALALLLCVNVAAMQRGINGLPEVLQGYQEWRPIFGPWDDPAIQAPHRGVKRLFTNLADAEEAYQNGTALPEGSIMVLEVTQPGQDFPSVIAYMHKYSEASTTSPNWHFELYLKDDKDLPFAYFNIPAAACRGCHARAPNDFVYRQGEQLPNP